MFSGLASLSLSVMWLIDTKLSNKPWSLHLFQQQLCSRVFWNLDVEEKPPVNNDMMDNLCCSMHLPPVALQNDFLQLQFKKSTKLPKLKLNLYLQYKGGALTVVDCCCCWYIDMGSCRSLLLFLIIANCYCCGFVFFSKVGLSSCRLLLLMLLRGLLYLLLCIWFKRWHGQLQIVIVVVLYFV